MARSVGKSIFLLACLLAAAPGVAQERAGITVRVISASRGPGVVDPALGDLHRQLSSLFGYSSYRLLDQRRFALSRGETAVIGLPGGLARPPQRESPGFRQRLVPRQAGQRTFEVTPLGMSGGFLQMRVKMDEDGNRLLDTQFRIPPGETIMIGGPPYGPGVLIVAVTLTP